MMCPYIGINPPIGKFIAHRDHVAVICSRFHEGRFLDREPNNFRLDDLSSPLLVSLFFVFFQNGSRAISARAWRIRVTTLIRFNAICSDNGRGQLLRPPEKFNLQENRSVPTFTDV